MLKIIKIRGKIVCKGPLIIRAKSPNGVDLGTAKIAGMPYIPGSTIKGALRHAAYKICSALGIKTCTTDRPCGIEILRKLQRYRLLHRYAEDDVLLRMGFCPVCILFGSPGLASKVIVNDAYPLNRITTEVRRFISIDEMTGSALPGRLFTAEIVPPKSVFTLEITAINVSEPLLGLLFTSIELLKDLGIGGMKTYGFGRVDVKIDSIAIRGVEYYIEGREITLSELKLEEFIRRMKRLCTLLKERYS